MPTLINVESGESFMKARDTTLSGQQQQQFNNTIMSHACGEDPTDFMNDTTLSGTMLEEALQAMSIEQKGSMKTVGRSNSVIMDKSTSETAFDGNEDNCSVTVPQTLQLTRSITEDSLPCRPLGEQARNRAMGPNEAFYRQKYASKHTQWIDQGRARYPDHFNDYRSQSTSVKLMEQQRVMNLLSRLGPRGMVMNVNDDDSSNSEKAFTSQSGDAAQLNSDSEQGVGMNADETRLENVHDRSMILFSPPVKLQIASPKTPASYVRFSGSFVERSDSLYSSTTSVEETRAQLVQNLPAAVHRKRMASMSGKRGADQSRIRTGGDSHGTSPSDDLSYGSPLRKMSPIKGNIFAASLSPISPRGTLSGANYSDSDVPMVPLHDSCDHQSDTNSSTSEASAHETLKETCWDSSRKDRHLLNESSLHDVILKTGVIYHYKALETTTNRSAAPRTFPDPLAVFEGSHGRRLDNVFEKLHRRDLNVDEVARAVVISVMEKHVPDVALKLLLLSLPMLPSQSRSESQCSMTTMSLQGQTLVVVRDKATVAAWSSTFREGSPFSVLDFLTLPVRQRKSISTATKLTKYGVVLTTFDALKAADVSYSIDECGHVVNQTRGDGEGWLQRRDSSQACRQTKQLTVLHSVSWHRVIFVDTMGRKCYLAKPDTSRQLAATALNSHRRYIFLSMSPDDETIDPLKDIVRDRKVATSLFRVLRTRLCEGVSLRQFIID
ncbi:hypothetical protein MPSEU_000570100 [Mayamaea pseudoterrestris]|nr:hypothetical protein MPSEU_000570100 [Mayamaea pseudoterrestris]